ncbi:MAG TPA: biotin-independent malonate decarboxylase subunit gamma [Caldimonas sp.]|jgi:malonate decarboxylase gamma subunit|nr:biotin-independent malonate decarboxylase subunit gamma [Caldimonas sp.]
MDWHTLATRLFGTDHAIEAEGDLLRGSALVGDATIAVIGTTSHAPIGIALALAQARFVLDTVERHPGRALLLLIDTQGQQLRRREELLGINRAMAHLGCCIDLARRRGHRVIGLVYDQALSGGFITSGLIADACYALPDAEIRVMRIPAMARITKIAEERLAELSKSSPVFAPGVENYVAMGGVRALWSGDLAAALREALATSPVTDERAADGAARGGRRLAAAVAQRVLDAP